MQILFNDEQIKCEDNITVTGLLRKLEQIRPGIAIAINQKILPREKWEVSHIREGDHVLLFQIIVGG